MSRQLFVNLPVKDLNKSVTFFTGLGFTFNQDFTDENATCMVVNEQAFVMLLVEPFFKGFTKKSISDATQATEVLISFSANSREEVDEIVKKALAAGGTQYAEAVDHGFMYQHSFADLDGHQWEIAWMDMNAMAQGQQ